MAQLAQLSSIALFGGAVGAICLGKAGLVAIRDRHSFTDALGKGLGVLGSTKVYAKHLGAEMQAGLPNPHAASHGGLTLLAWSAGKFGMGQASIGLKNKAQGALARLEVFDKWRAGVARKARFMLNREQRSLETYREAVRLFLAESWGHFELRANATKLARHGLPVGLRLDAESSALCCALAAGFEKAFPAKLGRGCLPEREKSKKNVLCVGVAEAVCLVVAGANDSDADPFYAPRADMPSLADLLGLSVAKALRDPEIRAAHAWVLSEISEPWIAALENKSIRAAVMPEMDSSANSASPAKKTNRL